MNDFFKSKRVLVAGGTGTIGVPLVKELQARGAHVTIVSLDSVVLARARLGDDISFITADLTDIDECNSVVRGQEFVFNLVGIKGSVGIGQTKVASYLIPMLRFQTNLMEASFKAGVQRFLFVGSICSYPQADVHYEDNVWNGMPRQNDRIPGIAKRVGELLGEAFELEYGWDAVRVLRPSNVYGPYDDFNPASAQVIPALIHKMLFSRGSVNVWGDGSAIRDFVYSDDVAFWMCEAMEKAPPNYPINIGSGTGVSIRQLAELIKQATRNTLPLTWDLSAPIGDPCRVLDVQRAKRTFGYFQRTHLREGLSKTISWYKSTKNLD